jgi:hypothetical protein
MFAYIWALKPEWPTNRARSFLDRSSSHHQNAKRLVAQWALEQRKSNELSPKRKNAWPEREDKNNELSLKRKNAWPEREDKNNELSPKRKNAWPERKDKNNELSPKRKNAWPEREDKNNELALKRKNACSNGLSAVGVSLKKVMYNHIAISKGHLIKKGTEGRKRTT